MNSKWIIATILVLALVATCAAAVFAAWQGVQMAQASGFSFRTGSFDRVEATATEQKTLYADGPHRLKVENGYGSVKVNTGAVNEVKITIEKTTWGGTDEEAQRALDDIQVVVEQKTGEIRIWVKPVVEVSPFHIGPRGHWVHFTITVPPETSTDLYSSNGDLALSGTRGEAVLSTGFGEVNVSDLSGELSVSTSSGKITARNIQAGESPIVLKTRFGDIEATALSAGDLTLESSNGDLVLEKVEVKGALNLSSDFGDLSLNDVQAGEITLKTQNGQIRVRGAAGKIAARSEYGDVDVTAEKAILTLASNNGKVTFTGSLAEGDHTLTSNFGDIRLTLPPDSALTFDLKADFGKIRSDFPVTISGELDEKRWKGNINGGGARLTASTQNGNISLQILK